MSKPQDVKRKLLGLSPDPGTPVLTAKKSGNKSPGPSSFIKTKESPLQKEVPTRQSPRKHRGGCKTGMLSSAHFLVLEREGERELDLRALMQRTMGIYAILGHFRHVGSFGKIEKGISVTLRLFVTGVVTQQTILISLR